MAMLVFGGVALGAGPAAGPTIEYATVFTKFKVVVGTGGGKVTGKIGSGQSECIAGRKVKGFRKRNGNKKKLGSDKTNDDGKWKIKVSSVKNGKYFAEVTEKDLAPADTGQARVCLGLKSGKVTIS
jgi:hypothetical protein